MPFARALVSRAARLRAWRTPFALFAALVFVAQAQALDISIPDSEVDSGGTITIPVRATDARGLSALQMSVAFDGAAIEVQGVSAGPILTNALVDFKASDGACTIAFATTQAVTADGDLLLLKLRRREGATQGSALTPENVRAWSGDGGQPMKVTVRAGNIAPLASGRSLDWRRLVALAAAVVAALVVAALGVVWRTRGKKAAPTPAPAPSIPPGAGPHFCSACGAPLSLGDNFCSNCGVKIARER